MLIDNYSSLTTILELNFKTVIPHFITEQIISPEEKFIEVDDFLEKIVTCLKNGHTDHFDVLLKIMKRHGNLSAEELAVRMEEQLSLKQ